VCALLVGTGLIPHSDTGTQFAGEPYCERGCRCPPSHPQPQPPARARPTYSLPAGGGGVMIKQWPKLISGAKCPAAGGRPTSKEPTDRSQQDVVRLIADFAGLSNLVYFCPGGCYLYRHRLPAVD